MTYDEMVFAGGYSGYSNKTYYLYYKNYNMWTLSPAQYNSYAYVWELAKSGTVTGANVNNPNNSLVPVINLNSNVTATGTGTSSDPYVIQTN